MSLSRRSFLKSGTAATVTAAAFGITPRPLLAYFGGRGELVPPIEDPRIKELCNRAIESAKSAGAVYADVRLTHTRLRSIAELHGIQEEESMTVGVRALVDGYWGFAAGPIWSTNELVRLGAAAVRQAKTNTLGKTRVVDLGTVPTVQDGHWTMPVAIDPFSVYPLDIQEYLAGLNLQVQRRPGLSGLSRNQVVFTTQEKAFASMTGSYYTQRVYRTKGYLEAVTVKDRQSTKIGLDAPVSEAGVGWEMYRSQPLVDLLQMKADQFWVDFALPAKPVDVGRYDIVLDAISMANLISPTIGLATELDRALGYEANAGGTSYLYDPAEMRGTFKLGSPLLNVVANRSEPGGLATVQWDDEGVTPTTLPLVKDGILANYQTGREGMGWLKGEKAAAMSQNASTVHSPGFFAAESGRDAPLVCTGNLVLTPAPEERDFEGCVATLDKGVAFRDMQMYMDFQQGNGMGSGMGFEIQKGKRVARLVGAGMLFSAPELLKNITALGGARSAERLGFHSVKGEPPQTHYHSVTAVPAVIKEANIIDVMRKA